MKVNNSYSKVSIENLVKMHNDNAANKVVNPANKSDIFINQNGKEIKLTFSDEYVKFKDDVQELLELESVIQANNSDNIFSYNSGDQWRVFSQYLSEEGFFESIGDNEMNNIESILMKITSGLDSLATQGISYGGAIVTSHMNSYEAQLEQASSASALSYFSDKFLSGDIKEGFDNLISDFGDYNSSRFENYKSLEEMFFSFRAELKLDETIQNPQAAENLAISNKLAKTTYSQEDKEDIGKKYADLLEKLKADKDTSILDSVREQLIEYVLKGIEKNDTYYDAAKEFVNSRAEDTFKRIEEYWKLLV